MILYYPDAIQIHGPNAFQYNAVNAVSGIVNHSAEGYWSIGYTPDDVMQQRSVSWHFSVFRDGHVEQHYPLNASCWHSGNAWGNTHLVGIEHEGRQGDPLTEAQRVASVNLCRWIAQQGGFYMTRNAPRTLWEHNELSSTTCPNGRIPWERYEEDKMEVTKLGQTEAVAALVEVVQQASPAISQQDGRYIGEAPAPVGYRDIVFRVRKED